MTDDRTLAALDQRGRAAAAGVRTAVAERPVPVLDPDVVRIDVDGRPEPSGRGRRSRPVVGLLAAAAAVLVVVAAVVALTVDGDPDSAPADQVRPGGPLRFTLATPPEGHVLAGVYDAATAPAPSAGETTSFGPLTVYGPDPETPVIGTYVLPLSADEMTSDPIPADRVAGRRAWRAQGAVADEGVLVDVGGRLVALAGVTAAEDDLLAAAAAVTVEGDRAVVPAEGLPDGWSALGEGHVFDLAPGTAALQTVDAGPVTWMAAYGSSGVGHVVVSVSEGDVVRVRAARLVTDDVEEVEVRGHDALLARTTVGTDPAVTVSVTWEERPGVIVQVASSADLDADVVLDLARAVVPVTTEALPDLRRQVMETQALDSGGAVVGRGTFGDVDWILVDRRDDGMLELLTTAVPGDFSSQGEGSGGEVAGDGEGPAPVFDGYTTGNVGALRYGLGEIAAAVAAVEVRDPDGTLVTEAAVVEGSGVRAWVAELPAGPDDRPYVVVALDAAGTELGTTSLHG